MGEEKLKVVQLNKEDDKKDLSSKTHEELQELVNQLDNQNKLFINQHNYIVAEFKKRLEEKQNELIIMSNDKLGHLFLDIVNTNKLPVELQNKAIEALDNMLFGQPDLKDDEG